MPATETGKAGTTSVLLYGVQVSTRPGPNSGMSLRKSNSCLPDNAPSSRICRSARGTPLSQRMSCRASPSHVLLLNVSHHIADREAVVFRSVEQEKKEFFNIHCVSRHPQNRFRWPIRCFSNGRDMAEGTVRTDKIDVIPDPPFREPDGTVNAGLDNQAEGFIPTLAGLREMIWKHFRQHLPNPIGQASSQIV